jgi:uncharacterized protein DUF4349
VNRRLSLAALFAVAVGLVAACAGASPAARPVDAPVDTSSSSGDRLDAAGNPLGPIPAPTSAPFRPNPGTGSDGDNSIPDQQLIVYTGSVNLEVADIDAAVSQAETLITGLGGHVAASNASDSGKTKSAKVTYRIPADKWAAALAGLKGLAARVTNEQTSSENVTGQVVDLDARIANLQSTEVALQGIMAKASTITDILKVQNELTQVQGDIESMTAQRDLLANQAALATLEVGFNVPATPEVAQASEGWDLGKEIDTALASLVRVGQGVASALIWLLIVALPVVLPIMLILWVGSRLYRRWQRAHPPLAAHADAAGQWPPSV